MATTALMAFVAFSAAVGAAGAPAGTEVCASILEVGDHEAWGIGGPRSSYADGSTKCWVLRGASHVTVDLSFFETEFEHDFLRLYDGEDAAAAAVELSGEVPRSFVWRSTRPTVYAVFAADGSFRANEATDQLGFEATSFDSSDGDTCAKACSGHGTCTDGLCNCAEGWGPAADTDCSTRVAHLEPVSATSVDGGAETDRLVRVGSSFQDLTRWRSVRLVRLSASKISGGRELISPAQDPFPPWTTLDVSRTR